MHQQKMACTPPIKKQTTKTKNKIFLQPCMLIYFLFSFYWTIEVIRNVLHVTCAGRLASWYFNVQVDDPLGANDLHGNHVAAQLLW